MSGRMEMREDSRVGRREESAVPNGAAFNSTQENQKSSGSRIPEPALTNIENRRDSTGIHVSNLDISKAEKSAHSTSIHVIQVELDTSDKARLTNEDSNMSSGSATPSQEELEEDFQNLLTESSGLTPKKVREMLEEAERRGEVEADYYILLPNAKKELLALMRELTSEEKTALVALIKQEAHGAFKVLRHVLPEVLMNDSGDVELKPPSEETANKVKQLLAERLRKYKIYRITADQLIPLITGVDCVQDGNKVTYLLHVVTPEGVAKVSVLISELLVEKKKQLPRGLKGALLPYGLELIGDGVETLKKYLIKSAQCERTLSRAELALIESFRFLRGRCSNDPCYDVYRGDGTIEIREGYFAQLMQSVERVARRRGAAKKILQEYGIYLRRTTHHCGGKKVHYHVLDAKKLERFVGLEIDEICREFEIFPGENVEEDNAGEN